MLAAMLVVQITVTSSAPPLSPTEAVAVLRASGSISDRTDAPVYPEPPPSIVIQSRPKDGPYGGFPPFPLLRPLNCCSSYAIRLPRGYGRQTRVPLTSALAIPPPPRGYRGVPLTSTRLHGR